MVDRSRINHTDVVGPIPKCKFKYFLSKPSKLDVNLLVISSLQNKKRKYILTWGFPSDWLNTIGVHNEKRKTKRNIIYANIVFSR